MLAHRKQLTLVSNFADLSIQTPTLLNDSRSTPTTPTGKDHVISRLTHRRNPSMPPTPSSPLASATPRSPLHEHHRRRTFGGDTSPSTTRFPNLDIEERIALLESTNKRLSLELEETRDALLTEREVRPPTRKPSDQNTQQSEVIWERKLRMEMLEALKKVRTQNTVLSRSVREHKEECESISSILAEERTHREQAEDEIGRLTQVNFTLFEHNKLLVGRDLAFQRMTSSIHPEDPSAFQKQPNATTTSIEEVDSLRSRLNAASDELHIAKLRLASAEEKSSELSEHVSFLRRQMTQCLDSSTQALEVERELRAEFMGRANVAGEENRALRAEVEALKRRLPAEPVPFSIRRRVPILERIANRAHSRRQTRTMVATFSAPKKAKSASVVMPPSLHKLFRTASHIPKSVPFKTTWPKSSTSETETLESPVSVASTLVSPKAQAVHTLTSRTSVLLSATLSRKSGQFSFAYKAVPTCSINVMDTCITDSADDGSKTVTVPALMDKVSNKRASVVLADIALKDSGWDVVTEGDVS